MKLTVHQDFSAQMEKEEMDRYEPAAHESDLASPDYRQMSRETLAPETCSPLDRLVNAPAIELPTLMAYGRAMFERSIDLKGRLFSFCVNLHSKKVGQDFAGRITNAPLFNLNGGLGVSGASSAIAAWIPAVSETRRFHTHGILLLPPSTATPPSVDEVEELMRTVHRRLRGHKGVVHLEIIKNPDDIPEVTAYMLKNVRVIRPQDQALEFSGGNRNIWGPIQKRVEQLLAAESAKRSAERRAAQARTDLLRSEGFRRLKSINVTRHRRCRGQATGVSGSNAQ
jgi:hypothetical protein